MPLATNHIHTEGIFIPNHVSVQTSLSVTLDEDNMVVPSNYLIMKVQKWFFNEILMRLQNTQIIPCKYP